MVPRRECATLGVQRDAGVTGEGGCCEVCWLAEMRSAGGMPIRATWQMGVDCAEKKKGVTEKFRNPFFGFGAGCRTRTRHLMITNQLLYQMS